MLAATATELMPLVATTFRREVSTVQVNLDQPTPVVADHDRRDHSKNRPT